MTNDSGNGFAPDWHQTIPATTDELSSMGTKLSEILIKIEKIMFENVVCCRNGC